MGACVLTNPVLITGLPRSRTAWLSIAASMMGNAICLHEPVRDCATWQESLGTWRRSGYAYSGISDHAMGFHLPHILCEYKPNTLVIHRRQTDVYSSLRGIGVDAPGYLEVLSARIGRCLRHPLVMQVDYDELRDPHTLMDCLEWLMPGSRPDIRKAEMMVRMNVQADIGMLHEDVARIGHTPESVLGSDVVAELAEFRLRHCPEKC